MKWITGYYILFIFLCELCFNTLFAKDIFYKADSLSLKGQVDAALYTYEKIAYQSISNQVKAQACLKSIECYKEFSFFEKGSELAKKFNGFFGVEQELLNEIKYQGALCSYLQGNYNEAGMLMAFMDTSVLNINQKQKYFLLQAYNAVFQYDYEKAHANFVLYVNANSAFTESREKVIEELARAFQKKNLPKIKRDEFAFWLNLLPGLGHVYAGKTGEGILSFSLNAASLVFGVHQVYYGYYITGYFLGSGLLMKFYYGSHERKTYLIKQRNFRENEKFKQSITEVVNSGKE